MGAQGVWEMRFKIIGLMLSIALWGFSSGCVSAKEPGVLASGDKGQQVMLTAEQSKVVWMKHLWPDRTCHPMEITGTVIWVGLSEDQTLPVAATIEADGGEEIRTRFMLPPVNDVWTMYTRGWIVDGYQMFFRKGQHLDVTIAMCGAAGRFLVLDGVQYSGR
jgi:hypothetical protein